MWISRSLVLFSLSLVSLVSAASKVTSPAAGDKIVAGQPTTVKWTSDSKGTISLSICWNSGNSCQPFAQDLDNTGSYSWTPDSSLQPRSDYYILLIPSDQQQYPSSGLFSITAASTSTTAAPSSTGASSTTGGPASTTTGSSSATSSPDSSGSSSNGGIIGGAIAAVVVVIVVAVIGFIWMRKRNQKKLAEARAGNGNDDGESGEKKRGLTNGAAGVAGKKKDGEKGEAYAPKEGVVEAASIPMAELPAMQQEAVEMSAVPSSPSGGTKFFAMELDSREIQRPGSAVKPDVDPTSNPTSPIKSPTGRPSTRNTSIDGTTVNTETERPKTAGSIEQIKESSQENVTQSTPSAPAPELPRPSEEGNGGPSVRDSMPQIGSIPKLGGFDFDTAKF